MTTTTNLREQLSSSLRFLLFPSDDLDSPITIEDCQCAYSRATTDEDREAMCAALDERPMHQFERCNAYTLSGVFSERQNDRRWQELGRRLLERYLQDVAQVWEIVDFYEHAATFGPLSERDLAWRHIESRCCSYDDWRGVYDRLDRQSEVGRDAAFRAMLAAARTRDELLYVLGRIAQHYTQRTWLRPWKEMLLRLKSDVTFADACYIQQLWAQAFLVQKTTKAAKAVGRKILRFMESLCTTPAHRATVWSAARKMKDDMMALRQISQLRRTCAKWSFDDWAQVLGVTSEIDRYLATMMKRYYWPLVQDVSTAKAAYWQRAEHTWRWRAHKVALAHAVTMHDWMVVCEMCLVMKRRKVEWDARERLHGLAQTFDDWRELLEWPHATEDDRQTSIVNLRRLCA